MAVLARPPYASKALMPAAPPALVPLKPPTPSVQASVALHLSLRRLAFKAWLKPRWLSIDSRQNRICVLIILNIYIYIYGICLILHALSVCQTITPIDGIIPSGRIALKRRTDTNDTKQRTTACNCTKKDANGRGLQAVKPPQGTGGTTRTDTRLCSRTPMMSRTRGKS